MVVVATVSEKGAAVGVARQDEDIADAAAEGGHLGSREYLGSLNKTSVPCVGPEETGRQRASCASAATAGAARGGVRCRSGRFSPSAARRAGETRERPQAVRRTYSAMEADMILPHSSRTLAAKRSLHSTVNGNGNVNGGGAVRREPGERSGRRLDSPTSKHLPPPSPAANSAIHRQASLDGGATRLTPNPNCFAHQGRAAPPAR
ncbi:hypothetical protein GUJ93_ZPchr0013g37070 [Zizania palustris]|uniref:Uncharacterized protein n=1 Tax=Zizania palustris TaxID=103762 RepID=A0A8J5X2H3_ZIZPA|nr:hypothetical protein GUJ93_ZPchr0013g37070 [Zizania palustris]